MQGSGCGSEPHSAGISANIIKSISYNSRTQVFEAVPCPPIRGHPLVESPPDAYEPDPISEIAVPAVNDSSKSRIVIAMSGGLDSSVAAARLVDEGYEVIGVTLHLWENADPALQSRCCAPEDRRDARRVADQLGFPHYTLDRREQFGREIVEPFVDAYLTGRTPSPCGPCNERIKIPALLRFAQLIDAPFVATGHYARIVGKESPRLARGVDRRKDQSYFLSTLDACTLRRLRLPLGQDTKEQVRAEAIRRGLVGSSKGESQDLCFVPDGSYARFVAERAGERVRPGWVVDENGRRLARHEGIHHFTLGQRKGLGIAVGRAVFVTRIDAEQGLVVVQDAGAGRVTAVTIARPTLALGVELPVHAVLQVRYRDGGAAAWLDMTDDGCVRARFDEPIRCASPGQLAVAYVDDEVVLGGTITACEH